MSDETSKAAFFRRKKDSLFVDRVFNGVGIDIGCGPDILTKEMGFPLIKSVEPFDLEHGDAQYINSKRPHNYYDFVHSSQCLEHMVDPYLSLKNWFELVKPDGYLVCTFPDEDLYEQGYWPSIWNSDHKWTFSIYKKQSWSPKHINVTDLVSSIYNAKTLRIDLVDTNYDYSILESGKRFDQTLAPGTAEAFIEIILQKCHD